ncbi:MAG TPA: hypothetical protein ENI29_17125, partial [bacterium]|nr:hypothetical protein [bacterium]
MKTPVSKTYLILLIITLQVFSFTLNLTFIGSKKQNNSSKDIITKLGIGGFWNLTGTPISIDDNNPSYNWAITAATNDWIDGSGTFNNPYIIENVTINGQSTGSCIEIQNSEVFFEIRNNTLYNSEDWVGAAGINLINVKNALIVDNNLSNNLGQGIILSTSQNSSVIGNEIINNGKRGIAIFSSDNNTIKDNEVNLNGGNGDNLDSGIYLTNSDSNIVKNNIVKDNTYSGIVLRESCSSNLILGNFINNSEHGVFSEWNNNDYNKILTNNITYNDYGIYFKPSLSDHNTISGNIISNNDIYGILLDDADQNTIYMNNLINNTINGYDGGISNQWDSGSIGNYWDNYGGFDTNDDGIGDTAHDVLPGGGSVDNYPIWEDGDDVSPNIIINSPNVDEIFGFDAPEFNITVIDQSLNTTWYTFDGGIANFTFTGFIGFINQTAWDSQVSNIITLRFYANDSAGNLGFKDINITKDTVFPKIIINSPAPNQLCGTSAPYFSLLIIELNILEKRYSLNGRPNITFTAETQISQSEWNSVGNGTVLIVFSIIDEAGNSNSSEIFLKKD